MSTVSDCLGEVERFLVEAGSDSAAEFIRNVDDLLARFARASEPFIAQNSGDPEITITVPSQAVTDLRWLVRRVTE